MKKTSTLIFILLCNLYTFSEADHYIYGAFKVTGSYSFPNNGISGTGTFNQSTSVPDFNWNITTSNNKLQSYSIVMNTDEMPLSNAWESKYGETKNAPMLSMRHSGNGSSNGSALGTPLVLSITFPTPTASSKCGFLLLDVDVDQVDIAATRPNGTSFSNAEITSWLIGAGNAAGKTAIPCWASSTATAVGSGRASTTCVRSPTIQTSTDSDGDYFYFEPNAAVQSLKFTFYNLQPTATTSIRVLIAAAANLILPVDLGGITAEWYDNQSVTLKWHTLSETAAAHFEIMHSNDGNNFQVAGSVSASGAGEYKWLHRGVTANSTLYYRLKMVDRDQSFSFSEVIKVEPKRSVVPSIKVYPNPATDYITVDIHNIKKQRFTSLTNWGVPYSVPNSGMD